MYACNGSKLDITDLTKNQALDVSLPNQMYNNAVSYIEIQKLTPKYFN